MTQHFLDVIENAPAQGFEPSRAVALDRLNGFVAKAGSLYARQRNFDFGPGKHSKVSGLSPWIRHRVLLEEDVISAVFADHDLQAAEKFIQEVFWRGYFKGWLEHRPEVWRYYKQDVVTLFDELEKHAGRAKAYEDAVSGRTGIEGFDAWARELIETGYLHNHAR
ncbi:MAG: FAD-binding domain-containing protein, partial [Pseudomonadota bacterium]